MTETSLEITQLTLKAIKTHTPKVAVEDFNIAMHNFQGN